MTTLILLLTIVILFSALFSGMEIAFVSSNRLLLGIDSHENSMTSHVINKYYANSNNFVSSLLVGNNIVLVIYGMLMARLLQAPLDAILDGSTSMHLLTKKVSVRSSGRQTKRSGQTSKRIFSTPRARNSLRCRIAAKRSLRVRCALCASPE